ncbi:MAG: type II secretion system protein [Candidatus Harrisonbacteria bacterium]|nr:type II secretion system protein [Candidatus Harrisonbacteria bacterium]
MIYMEKEKGITLLEIIIAMGLVVGITAVLTAFIADLSDYNLRFANTLTGQQNAQQALQVMMPEIRSATQSNIGNYPIEEASTSTLIFYTDTNQNGFFERVRYFLEGDVLKKGVIEPSGSPLIYDTNDEVLRDIVPNIRNGSSSLFSYFSNTATSSESAALTQPVDVQDVSMVKVLLIFEQGSEQHPNVVGIESQTTVRNIRF